ncbi:MAG: hypothetical protein WC046_08070 [Candidatus Bathyarchaeia archaeon]
MGIKKKNFNTKLLAVIVIIIIVTSISLVAANYILSKPTDQNNNLPAMTLTLVGSDGTTKTLTESDIATLEAYTGKGAKMSNNQIKNEGTYTGIAVTDLLDLVGGMKDGETLTAIAQDGYANTYNYKQAVNGEDYITYNTSANVTAATQPLKLVVIYYKDGLALSSDDGPLQMGVLGVEGLATPGNVWGKMIVKLQINPIQTPQPTASSTPKPTIEPTTTSQPTQNPTATLSPTITIADTKVTIIGADNSTVTLDQDDLVSYAMISGLGGKYKSDRGVFDYGTYAGVPMMSLLTEIGGMSSGQILSIKAIDGYVKNYTYSEVTGSGLTMYNPTTASVVTPSSSVNMILAYHLNGTSTNLDFEDNAYLMVSFVGSDGYATIANMFAKFIVEIRVYNQ